MKINSEVKLRHDWSYKDIETLFNLSFNNLLFRATTIHRANFDPNLIQISQLLSIKTGKCQENCKYCPQSVHNSADIKNEDLLAVEIVLEAARLAKDSGASRFCMSAAWREPTDNNDFDQVLRMIEGVRALGLETCASLGMLNCKQAQQLKEAGLDYYNHNIDTSPEKYNSIIETRTFDDRLNTIDNVRATGIKVCCGGIVGIGEQQIDRIRMLQILANMDQHPENVPINLLVKVPGTALDNIEDVDPFDFIKTIAVTRILMPRSYVRLSAGRKNMSDEMQALCIFAGANSMFCGNRLLTTENPSLDSDKSLFSRLGLKPE
ncbi:MAG: biotin synthase BioB [Rhodospirillaceae bacterium]|nr:biotin synthase BioB [Rhodospirillaceae bacterium]